jgi:uncharacterized membrane protein
MNILSRILLIIASVSLLNGCSAIDKSIKHGTLDVQTRMSETVFLDPVADDKKTVILQIRNTSDKKDLEIQSEIKIAIEDKGYKIVTDPNKAHYMIQANILQVGKSTNEDPFSSLSSGFGGALAGGTMGALISNNYSMGMGIGALAGGLIGTVADSAVQVINYQMITDLQISEKADSATVTESSNAQLKQGSSGNKSSSWSEKSKWKKYQTRIISVAKKTNLKFELALPELKRGLIQSISGLL